MGCSGAPQCTCGAQRTSFRSRFSISTMWVLGSGCQTCWQESLPSEPPCWLYMKNFEAFYLTITHLLSRWTSYFKNC